MKFHNKSLETRVIINCQRHLLVLVLMVLVVVVPNKRYRTALKLFQLLEALKPPSITKKNEM